MHESTVASRALAAVTFVVLCPFLAPVVAIMAVAGAIKWTWDLVQAIAVQIQRAFGRADLRAVATVSRVPSLREIEHGLGSETSEGGRRCGVCGKET